MERARDRLFADAGDLLRYRISEVVDKHAAKLGSPIERLYLESLLTMFAAHLQPIPHIDDDPGPDKFMRVFLQPTILDYRVDFAICAMRRGGKRQVNIIVECDGHEFHERTKEQAARDRKRDRDLQGEGYMVLRFTGSQIYRDPLGCAGETFILAHEACKRADEDAESKPE